MKPDTHSKLDDEINGRDFWYCIGIVIIIAIIFVIAI